MPTTEVIVRITDGAAFRRFVQAVADVRDFCAEYDEASANYGDVERIGDQLDEALEDLRRETLGGATEAQSHRPVHKSGGGFSGGPPESSHDECERCGYPPGNCEGHDPGCPTPEITVPQAVQTKPDERERTD